MARYGAAGMIGLGFGASALHVLVLGAHADDIEIGCGGFILDLIARDQPITIDWCVLSASTERTVEARNSAEQFLHGAQSANITIESFQDGHFPYHGAALKAWFESLKQRPRPDLILTHALHDRHQDHREIAHLTWNTFRNHFILEYEIPKYEGDLQTPNFYVPLTEAVLQRKVDILLSAFASQRAKSWFDADTFRSLARLRGLECASPTRFAEGFHARKLVLAR